MIFLLLTDCNQGWSVVGIEISPSDTTNTVFTEIVDVDSVVHWYHNVNEYSNWCYRHEQYEEVKKQ